MEHDKTERLTLSVLEAASALGVGKNQIYEAIHRGEIPAVRIGKRLLVPIAALEQKLAGAAR
jgi:excisionase family DNA binding protein